MRSNRTTDEDQRRLEAVRAKVARSLADPRPSILADEVFERVYSSLKSLATNKRRKKASREGAKIAKQ